MNKDHVIIIVAVVLLLGVGIFNYNIGNVTGKAVVVKSYGQGYTHEQNAYKPSVITITPSTIRPGGTINIRVDPNAQGVRGYFQICKMKTASGAQSGTGDNCYMRGNFNCESQGCRESFTKELVKTRTDFQPGKYYVLAHDNPGNQPVKGYFDIQ